MPVWNEKTKDWVSEGKLVVLGIAQEQHRRPCRLFAQWRDLKWPILHDPINVMGVKGVPIEVAVDEYGIVRSVNPDMKDFEKEFLNKSFAPPDGDYSMEPVKAKRPDLDVLRLAVKQNPSAEAWRKLGDAQVLWGNIANTGDTYRSWGAALRRRLLPTIDEAIESYIQAIECNPNDGAAHFRLGVCCRMRYDTKTPVEGDFQTAVDYWYAACLLDRGQYIWRRRIEQYGARKNKPYPFYDWVETARKEIAERGDRPLGVAVRLLGSEVAKPAGALQTDGSQAKSPDPDGQVTQDIKGLVRAEVTIVPRYVKPGESVRVYVTLGPKKDFEVHWNLEPAPLKFWVGATKGSQVEPQLVVLPNGPPPGTVEPCNFDFDLHVGADVKGSLEVPTYALYYVRDRFTGVCYYLRQDIPVTITVD